MLKINNLKAGYGDHLVLQGVSMECTPGEIHGLLGMNGAGKTTLFRTIYGFKKMEAGSAIFKNESVTSRSIAMLETSPFFYSYMKGREYLDIVSTGNEQFEYEKWNQLFNLPLNDLIDTYSTGMKKKLAFLGVISLDRPIMILDEPFSGVDVESNEKIFQILKKIKAQGKVILLSSHILESFTGICDKISVLKNGLIERTYEESAFAELERILKEEVRKNISQTLDELF